VQAADEARFIFEKMLTYANHLGLYAEEIGAPVARHWATETLRARAHRPRN